MFKLQRQNIKSSKSGERVDFKLSNFQALQVPKGWDRLFLSMISVESGKTVAKLGKAVVRSGNCQWTETLLESAWISKDDSSKEPEECLFKFVVSMGSSRAGILGEATINLLGHMSSKASSPVLLPLKKCNYGTVLQVKIHCLSPRPNIRDPKSNVQGKNEDVDYNDVASNSDASDNSLVYDSKNSSSKDLDVASHQGNHNNKQPSYSEAGSHHISNYAESLMQRDPFNSMNDLNSNGHNTHQRHIGASSNSSSRHDNYPADDCSFSSQSSSNSGITNSRMDLQSSGKESSEASPGNAGFKNLLEAAEGTIEELRVEAKMWERNARKLMLDLDMLRNEFLDQSKKQADLVMELSAAHAENSGLKKEIEQLKGMLEESTEKQRALEDSTFQSKGLNQVQKELESEVKYQQQSNANLSLQLKRSQESNIELVSILQELEQTIEQQKVEIENLSSLQLKYTDFESSAEQNLEEKRNLLLQLQQLQESEKTLKTNVQHLEKALDKETNELENERSLNSKSLLDVEREYKYQLSVKDEEIAKLEANVTKSASGRLLEDIEQNNGSDLDLIKEIESLREKVHELERDCNELTDENLELLLKIKDSKNMQIKKCASFSSASSELPTKSVSMQSDVSDTESQLYAPELKVKMSEAQWATFDASELFCEIFKQLEMAFHILMKPLSNISSDASEKCKFLLDDLMNLTKKNSPNLRILTESIVNYFFELNKLLEDRITEFVQILKCDEKEIQKRNDTIAEARKNLEDHILKIQQHERSKAEVETNCQNLMKELSQKRSEIDKLQVDLRTKEQQASSHIKRQRELEIQIADLQTKKDQLETNNETVQREHRVTSKCLDDLQSDMVVLSSSSDSHITAKEIIERKSADLEMEKHVLENKLMLLEDDKLQLQESISIMDVQMRHLADEKESCQLELKNSKFLARNLQDQIRNLEVEMEAYKANLNKKIQDTQDQLLESQRRCDCLNTENQDLQSSALRLAEESKILQKLNKELKKKEMELQEHCGQMEAHLDKSEKRFSDCSKKVEALEANLSSMLEALSLRGNSLNSELDALLKDYSREKEKLVSQETLSNQMHLEMSAEVKNLQKEVESLREHISAAHEEKERTLSEASCEISSLHADKRKLESALQELHSKLELNETQLNTLQVESELKMQGLRTDLAASKESHVMLMADHERLLKQLASYRTAEEKLKTAVNNLELKLSVADYENQQLREENAEKKIHFQKIADLQDEVSVLKSKVEEYGVEKENLEASLQAISRDYEGLKAEKVSYGEKVLSLQEDMTEYEIWKQKAISLEEKLLQVENALLTKETFCAQYTDLENELNEVRKANKQYQQKICQLEEEKLECLQKVQALEMDLEKKHNCGRKCDNKFGVRDESPHPDEVAHELAEELDEDNIHKTQLQSFSSEEQSNEMAYSKKSMRESQAVTRERYERTKSSLETELRDLRERYLHMSLKYAEVEAQREDLVMKLKVAKSGKRWLL